MELDDTQVLRRWETYTFAEGANESESTRVKWYSSLVGIGNAISYTYNADGIRTNKTANGAQISSKCREIPLCTLGA